MTILVWGLLLEIVGLIYLDPTRNTFVFTYNAILFIFTLIALVILIMRLKKATG